MTPNWDDLSVVESAAPSWDELESVEVPKPAEGGFVASAKQAIGATIKGAGQAASDFIPGVSDDNAVKRYGQSVVDANPTAVHGFADVVDKPLTTVTEATGNAAGSMGGMLGARALGMGITAAAPLTGPLAPAVALAGQAVAWFGPAAIAALPSFGSIRDKQILNDPANEADAKSKAIAALGAATVGVIESKFGPQEWALSAMTKEGRIALAKKFESAALTGTLTGTIAKGVAKGGAIEGAEELVQNPIEQAASYDDPTTPESLKETAFGGFMGAVGGGVLGGAAGGLMHNKPTPKSPETIIQEIVDPSKSLDESIDTANTLLNESPEIRTPGSFGAMNEFADLLNDERADVERRRTAIASEQSQAEFDALRKQEEIDVAIRRNQITPAIPTADELFQQHEIERAQTPEQREAVFNATPEAPLTAMQVAMAEARRKANSAAEVPNDGSTGLINTAIAAQGSPSESPVVAGSSNNVGLDGDTGGSGLGGAPVISGPSDGQTLVVPTDEPQDVNQPQGAIDAVTPDQAEQGEPEAQAETPAAAVAAKAPVEESTQERSEREFGENYDRVQQDINGSSTKDLYRAVLFADKAIQRLNLKAQRGEPYNKDFRNSLIVERDYLKGEWAKREDRFEQPPTATPTMGEIPTVAPSPFKAIAQRQVNAQNNFIDSVVEQFGLTKDQASDAWNYYVKNKLVKVDSVGGQYSLKDGRMWDGDALRKAAGIEQTATPETPAPKIPQEVTRNKKGHAEITGFSKSDVADAIKPLRIRDAVITEKDGKIVVTGKSGMSLRIKDTNAIKNTLVGKDIKPPVATRLTGNIINDLRHLGYDGLYQALRDNKGDAARGFRIDEAADELNEIGYSDITSPESLTNFIRAGRKLSDRAEEQAMEDNYYKGRRDAANKGAHENGLKGIGGKRTLEIVEAELEKVKAEREELNRQARIAAELADDVAEQELIDAFNLEVGDYQNDNRIASDDQAAESARLSAEIATQEDSDQLDQNAPVAGGEGFTLEANQQPVAGILKRGDLAEGGAEFGQWELDNVEKRTKRVEYIDNQGEAKTKLVADMDNAEISHGSGMSIANIFWLKRKGTGEVKPFGSETAPQAMGISPERAAKRFDESLSKSQNEWLKTELAKYGASPTNDPFGNLHRNPITGKQTPTNIVNLREWLLRGSLSREQVAKRLSNYYAQPAQERPSLDLAPESNEEIAAREAANRAAEAQQQEEAAKAEVDAKKAREQAEIASRQDVAAENFTLDAQVNNKSEQKKADAKRTEDQLAGQGDIFSQQNQEPRNAKPVAENGSPAQESSDGEVANSPAGVAPDPIGWNKLDTPEREELVAKAGWVTERGSINPAGRNIVRRSWEEIPQGTRDTLVRFARDEKDKTPPSSPLEAFADAQLKAAQALKDAVAPKEAATGDNAALIERLRPYVWAPGYDGLYKLAGDRNRDLRRELATEILGRKATSKDITLKAMTADLVDRLGGKSEEMAIVEQERFLRDIFQKPEAAAAESPPVGAGDTPVNTGLLGRRGESAMKSIALDPDESEANFVQSGIDGKTPQDAAQFIIDNGSPAQSEIAKKVKFALDSLARAGVKLELKIAHVGDEIPKLLTVARGMTDWYYSASDNHATIWLNGTDVIGKVGVSYEAVLHELVHAATSGAIHWGGLKEAVDGGYASAADVRDLTAVANHVFKYRNQRFADAESGKIELTDFEQRLKIGLNNAFADAGEIITWGLTNSDAQAYLEAIPYPAHKNAWTAFVDAIRRILGLPEKSATALSEVLRVSENLMGESVHELLGLKPVGGQSAIQSAVGGGIQINKNAALNPDNGVLESRKKWYRSQLESAIDQVPAKIDNGPGNQWALWLQSNAGKLQVKADELKWSGVLDYLQMQGKNKVSKEQVQDFLLNNNVQVKDVVLGAQGKASEQMRRALTGENLTELNLTSDDWLKHSEMFEKTAQSWQRAGEDDKAERYFALSEEANRLAEGLDSETGSTEGMPKFASYQLPGGAGYKELLITLPEKVVEDNRKFEFSAEQSSRRTTLLAKGRLSDSEAAELGRLNKLKQDSETTWSRDKIPDTKNFQSSHFEQKNILAHIRMNERVDATGAKVLFLEEVQGDWPQAYRKQQGAIGKAVDDDFTGIVERMKKDGVLSVECD